VETVLKAYLLVELPNQRYEPTVLAPAVSPPQGAGNEPKEIQSATPQALRELSERFDARNAILRSGVDSRRESQLNLFDVE
jgi:hypothetical protein